MANQADLGVAKIPELVQIESLGLFQKCCSPTFKIMGMLIISQGIQTAKQHLLHLKHIHFLFVEATSAKVEKNNALVNIY